MNGEKNMYENIDAITVILTSAVAASLVTSVANIIIAIYNNHRLKAIEEVRQKNDLNAYRYKCLYDMLLKWQEYDTPLEIEDKGPVQIAEERLTESFFDGQKKFQIISPLLDEKYKKNANRLSDEGNELIKRLFDTRNELNKKFDEELEKKYKKLMSEFYDIAYQYASELEKILHLQLEELLRQNA